MPFFFFHFIFHYTFTVECGYAKTKKFPYKSGLFRTPDSLFFKILWGLTKNEKMNIFEVELRHCFPSTQPSVYDCVPIRT